MDMKIEKSVHVKEYRTYMLKLKDKICTYSNSCYHRSMKNSEVFL